MENQEEADNPFLSQAPRKETQGVQAWGRPGGPVLDSEEYGEK